ncbi:hypothetical protein ACUUMB_21180 [Enterobacter kobei]
MIKMKASKSVLVMLAVVLLLSGLLVGVMHYYQNQHKTLNFSCSAHLNQVNSEDDFSLSMAFILTLQPDGKGLAVMDGNVAHKSKGYKLRRDLEFTYEPYSDDLYKLTGLKLIKGARDTTPMSLLPMDYKFLYIVKIRGVDNAALVGAVTFPAFMCLTN